MHVRYLRELHESDPVRVTFQLLDYDAKRMHYFEQLFHAEEGWVSATSENMSLHVDMGAKKVSPFPPQVARCLARMKAAHAQLPRPEAVGPADHDAEQELERCSFGKPNSNYKEHPPPQRFACRLFSDVRRRLSLFPFPR